MSKAAGAVVIHLAARGCISGESVMRRHRTRFAQFFLGHFLLPPLLPLSCSLPLSRSRSQCLPMARRGGSMSDRNLPNNDARPHEYLRLLAQYDLRLRGFVFTLVPNWADAEDIVQEVKLRLWEQFDDYDPTRTFGPGRARSPVTKFLPIARSSLVADKSSASSSPEPDRRRLCRHLGGDRGPAGRRWPTASRSCRNPSERC